MTNLPYYCINFNILLILLSNLWSFLQIFIFFPNYQFIFSTVNQLPRLIYSSYCVKWVTAQVPVINTNSDSNTFLSSFLLYRSHDSKTKSVNKNYMDMKRILNYYKSDQVACFELLEP